MAFAKGRGFVILNSMAEDGNPDAQRLLKNLKSMPQDEFDAEFTQLLGSSKGGGSAKGSPKGDAKKGDAPEKAAKGEPAPKGKTAAAPKQTKSALEGIEPVESQPKQAQVDDAPVSDEYKSYFEAFKQQGNPDTIARSMAFLTAHKDEYSARVEEIMETEGVDSSEAEDIAEGEITMGELNKFFKQEQTPKTKATKGEPKKPPTTEQVDEMFNAFSNDKKIRDKDGVVRKADGSAIETDAEGKEINPAVRNAKQLGQKTNTNRQIPNYNNKATDPEASPEEAQKALQKNQALIGLKKQAKVYGVDDVTMLEMSIRKFGNDPQYAILKEIKEDIDASASLDEQAKASEQPKAPDVAAKKTKTNAGDLYDFAKENKNNQSLTQAIIDFENTAESGEFNLEKFQEYLDKKSEDPDLSDNEKEFYENAHSQVEDELRTLVGMDRREPKQSDDAEFNANQEIINQRDTNDKAKQELFKQSDNLVDSYKKQGQSVTEAVNSAYEEALAMAGGEDSELLKTIRGQYSDLLRNKTLRPQDNLRDEIAARQKPSIKDAYDQPEVTDPSTVSDIRDELRTEFDNRVNEIAEADADMDLDDARQAAEDEIASGEYKGWSGVREKVKQLHGKDIGGAERPTDIKFQANTPNKPISPQVSKEQQSDKFYDDTSGNNWDEIEEAAKQKIIKDFSSSTETDFNNFITSYLDGVDENDPAFNDYDSVIAEYLDKNNMREMNSKKSKLSFGDEEQATPTGSAAEQGTDIYDFARENSNNQTISTYVSEFETYANDGEFTLPKFQEYLEMMSQDQDAPKSQRDDYAEKAALVAAELEFKTNYKTVPVKEAPAAVNELVEANPEIKQELNTILSFMQSSAKSKSIETANEWFMQNGRDFIDSYSGDPKDRQKMSQAYSELKKKLGIL
jgi:hypothetical protein